MGARDRDHLEKESRGSPGSNDLFPSLSRHGGQVYLVADYDYTKVGLISFGNRHLDPERVPPTRQLGQRLGLVDVEDENDRVRTTEERRGEGRKPLLACGVPDLKCDCVGWRRWCRRRGGIGDERLARLRLRIVRNCLCYKVRPDRCAITSREAARNVLRLEKDPMSIACKRRLRGLTWCLKEVFPTPAGPTMTTLMNLPLISFCRMRWEPQEGKVTTQKERSELQLVGSASASTQTYRSHIVLDGTSVFQIRSMFVWCSGFAQEERG